MIVTLFVMRTILGVFMKTFVRSMQDFFSELIAKLF